jgi:hypothetical protein
MAAGEKLRADVSDLRARLCTAEKEDTRLRTLASKAKEGIKASEMLKTQCKLLKDKMDQSKFGELLARVKVRLYFLPRLPPQCPASPPRLMVSLGPRV